MEQFFFASLGKTNKYLPLRLILCQADRIDEQSLLGIVKFLLARQIKHFLVKG